MYICKSAWQIYTVLLIQFTLINSIQLAPDFLRHQVIMQSILDHHSVCGRHSSIHFKEKGYTGQIHHRARMEEIKSTPKPNVESPVNLTSMTLCGRKPVDPGRTHDNRRR